MQNTKPKQWSQLEELHYHFFLITYLPRFQHTSKKNNNIFKQMELFIPSRNAEQCRSHHQKKTEKKSVVHVLKKFYHNYYEIRQLDLDHSIMELKHYLKNINPLFFNRKSSKLDAQSLIADFQMNMQNILQADRRDQDTQTYSQTQKESHGPDIQIGEISGLLFDTTQTSEFQLFVIRKNSDDQQEL